MLDVLRRDPLYEALLRGYPPDWASGWGEDENGVFLEFTVGEATQALRYCPPGRFTMGSPKDEAGYAAMKKAFDFYDGWEEPQVEVRFEAGFWMMEAPVTQALYEAVMGENPSRFVSETRPVERVSWNDAQAFTGSLNESLPGLDLRMPSEAEWEYACRAETEHATYAGPMKINGQYNAPVLNDIAWYGGNSGVEFELTEGEDSSGWQEKAFEHSKAGTMPVGKKDPNPWGLKDTLGNVWEWCADAWNDSHEGAAPDGSARPGSQQEDQSRVIRGGSWYVHAGYCRAAYRGRLAPDYRDGSLGFRLARGQTGAQASAAEPPEA